MEKSELIGGLSPDDWFGRFVERFDELLNSMPNEEEKAILASTIVLIQTLSRDELKTFAAALGRAALGQVEMAEKLERAGLG